MEMVSLFSLFIACIFCIYKIFNVFSCYSRPIVQRHKYVISRQKGEVVVPPPAMVPLRMLSPVSEDLLVVGQR